MPGSSCLLTSITRTRLHGARGIRGPGSNSVMSHKSYHRLDPKSVPARRSRAHCIDIYQPEQASSHQHCDCCKNRRLLRTTARPHPSTRRFGMDWDPEEEAQAAFGAFSRETLPAASAGGGGGAAAASGSGASAGGPASGSIDTGSVPSGIDSRAEERAKASARPMPSMTAENTKGVMLLLVFIHG